MSRVLSELLGAHQPEFSLMVKRLEATSGGNGVDINLSADILAKVRLKTKELGLDPADSNGQELYHALLHLVKIHDDHLVKALGTSHQTNISNLLETIQAAPEKLGVELSCWVIKHSVAKRLLVAKPPKTIMRRLGYRSIDSLLKRENIAEIYTALQFAEEPAWFNRFKTLLHRLQPTDFEARNIEIITLDTNKWGSLAEDFTQATGSNLCVSPEMGSVLLLPLPVEKLEGIAITVLPLLLEAINDIRLHSALFKLRQVQPNFGHIVATAVTNGLGKAATIAGQDIHWPSLKKYFAQNQTLAMEIFEPHLTVEDLSWRRAEDILFRLEPSLAFWQGLEYVGIKFGEEPPVSFNLLDVAVSGINDLEYGEQSVYHFRQSLWSELLIRYMGQKNVEREVLQQLEREMMNTPKLKRQEALV